MRRWWRWAAAACWLAACGRDRPAAPRADAPPDARPTPAATASALAFADTLAPDERPGDLAAAPDAEPIGPADVLSGAAAEQAIAAGATAAVEETPAAATGVADDTGPALAVAPDRVGPFRLGMPRSGVVAALGRRARLRRVPGARGPASVEVAHVPGEAGAPLLRVRLLGGRLAEVDVLAADWRAATDGGVRVGTTFGRAAAVHGEARPYAGEDGGRPVGFVLSDLPGVVMVPADPAALAREAPLAGDLIAAMRVVGPEETGAAD